MTNRCSGEPALAASRADSSRLRRLVSIASGLWLLLAVAPTAFSTTGETLEVTLTLPAGLARRGELFVEPEDIVEPGVVPTLADKDGKLVWTSRLTPNGRKRASGAWPAVWVTAPPEGSRRAYRVDVRLQ